MEEVRAHCERCYDDKDETSEVQAQRIRERLLGKDDHHRQSSSSTRKMVQATAL